MRLADPALFHRTSITTDGAPLPLAAGALAVRGPFRSDSARPGFNVKRVPAATADGEDALEMVVEQLELDRRDIGSIELELVAPRGRHVTLRWGRVGQLAVPVGSNREPFALSIRTDGFAEWTGPLGTLSILVADPGPVHAELRSIRLMPRIRAYSEPAGVGRVRVGDELRTAIHVRGTTEIRFPGLKLPRDARLSIGFASLAEDAGGRPTAFEVLVSEGAKTMSLARRSVAPGAAWMEAPLSLAGWGGRTVTLTLRSVPARASTLSFWSNPTVYQPVEKPPLAVLYLIDTLAAAHLDLYGYSRPTAPRLAELARRATLFAEMFSNASHTLESIPNLMLSMPVDRHGVHHASLAAPAELVTLAEALQAAGFATASFCTNVNAGPRQGMDQGFDEFIDRIGYFFTDDDRTVPLDEVRSWLARHGDRPMFAYVHTAEPHAPYAPRAGFRRRFDADYAGPFDGTFDPRHGFRSAAAPRDVAHVAALYDEEILYADHRFGLFHDLLSELGLLGRTHMVVTSDHGEEFLEHGWWEHGENLHYEQTRVPLIAAGPSFPPGLEVDSAAQLNDLMPTLLDLFGIDGPPEMSGQSLLPLVRAAAAAQPPAAGRPVYAANHFHRSTLGIVEYSVTVARRWKLIYGLEGQPAPPRGVSAGFRLFDLARDPRERRDVLAEHAAVGRGLILDLLSWRLAQRPCPPRTAPAYDLDHIRELQALGYLAGGAPSGDDTPRPGQGDRRGDARPGESRRQGP